MNYYIKRTYINSKKKIMKLDKTEIMPDSLPRSVHAIKILAAIRGSRIGVYIHKLLCHFIGGFDGKITKNSFNLSFL